MLRTSKCVIILMTGFVFAWTAPSVMESADVRVIENHEAAGIFGGICCLKKRWGTCPTFTCSESGSFARTCNAATGVGWVTCVPSGSGSCGDCNYPDDHDTGDACAVA